MQFFILAADCPPNCQHLWISHHPGIECLAFSDVVVGSTGYNTVYECASLGVTLVAIAPDKRASKCYCVQDIQTALDTVKMLLDRIEPAKKAICAILHQRCRASSTPHYEL